MIGSSATPADGLVGTKGDLIDGDGPSPERSLRQPGGLVLDEPFPVPGSGPADLLDGQARVETFVVDLDGRPTVVTTSDRPHPGWHEAARDLTGRIVAAARTLGVEPVGPAYLTISATPAEAVDGSGHLDDDSWEPDAGVGLVAIVGDGLGPRLHRAPLPVGRLQAPLPVEPDPVTVTRFEREAARDQPGAGVQVVAPGRVVLLPRFGQLHAGPPAALLPPGSVRTLLVWRAGTIPTAR